MLVESVPLLPTKAPSIKRTKTQSGGGRNEEYHQSGGGGKRSNRSRSNDWTKLKVALSHTPGFGIYTIWLHNLTAQSFFELRSLPIMCTRLAWMNEAGTDRYVFLQGSINSSEDELRLQQQQQDSILCSFFSSIPSSLLFLLYKPIKTRGS